MATSPDEELRHRLSGRGRELATVLLRVAGAPTRQEDAGVRVVESRRYRARARMCPNYYKPVSRCLDGNE